MTMAKMWMPGATTLASRRDGGSMIGGPARATEHVMVCPYTWSALQAARFLISQGTEAHLTLHPITGHIVQMIPAYRAARALANKYGGVQTNRQGRYNIQTEVVAMPNGWTKDLTEAGKAAVKRRAEWFDSLGIKDVWVGGRPPHSYAEANNGRSRSTSNWVNQGGWFGHSQVPENTHWDPGPIDPGLAMGKGLTTTTSGIVVPKNVGAEWRVPDDISTATIKALQKAVGVKVDGIMGPSTARATQAWLKVAVDGIWGRNTIKALQKKVGTTVDGYWGPKTAAALKRYFDTDAKGGEDLKVDGYLGPNTYRAIEKWLGVTVKGTWTAWDIRALQKRLGVRVDGIVGPSTTKALQRLVGSTPDGIWGRSTTKALQQYLNRVL